MRCIVISIHALLAESDQGPRCCGILLPNFYPRSPCGERPAGHPGHLDRTRISIHALLAESDKYLTGGKIHHPDFYPRSPCGERLLPSWELYQMLRISIHALLAESDKGKSPSRCCACHFYPRSPCGERLLPSWELYQMLRISIHALLAESDAAIICLGDHHHISIHALLAESDGPDQQHERHLQDFYPRSPCGERRSDGGIFLHGKVISIHALLAESDLGLDVTIIGRTWISIHALLAESDTRIFLYLTFHQHFYPRSPCGERPIGPLIFSVQPRFLSTLSLRRATLRHCTTYLNCSRFLSTLSLRRATVHYDNYNLHCVISIHALLAESDQRT